MIVTVTDDVVEIQPIHFIQLTVKAQIYALIIGPNWISFGQNDFIMSYYKAHHRVTRGTEEIDTEIDTKDTKKEYKDIRASKNQKPAADQSTESNKQCEEVEDEDLSIQKVTNFETQNKDLSWLS